MGLGKFATRAILDSPESEELKVLNVSSVTWSSGEEQESISTTKTDGLFQNKDQSSFVHLTQKDKESIDAVAYLEQDTDVSIGDKLVRSSTDIEFDIDNIITESGYKMLELREVI